MEQPPPQYQIGYRGTPLWRRGCFVVLVIVAVVVYVSWGHNGSAPQATATATPAAPASLAPGACLPPGTFPPAPAPELAGVEWQFGIGGIHEIAQTVVISAPVSATPPLDLELYTSSIDGIGVTAGLRSDGTAYVTETGSASAALAAAAPGASVTTSTAPPAVTIERPLGSLGAGSYSVTLSRGQAVGDTDLFGVTVAPPSGAAVTLGTLRFARATPGQPATIADAGRTVLLDPANAGAAPLSPVPVWTVAVSSLANGSREANQAVALYFQMPNSDVSAPQPGGFVSITAGGGTPRCHLAGPLWSNLDVAATPTPAL